MKKRTTSPSWSLEDVADGEEVAERLRHLLVVDLHEAVVQPVTHEARRPVRKKRAIALRDLVLVVGKLQVCAAAVDVERDGRAVSVDIAEHSMCQPGPTAAERRCPAYFLRLVRLGRLPEHEVERVLLAARPPPPARRPEGRRSTCRSSGRSRRTCARRRPCRHPRMR